MDHQKLDDAMNEIKVKLDNEFQPRGVEENDTNYEMVLDWDEIEPQLRDWKSNQETLDALNVSFDELSSQMLDIGPGDKLKKMLKLEGEGELIPPNAIAYVHYNMYCEMEQVPFDSTYLRSFPTKIILGEGSVIPGIEFAILSMKKGEKSQFLIHPDLAFGELGAPPRIPPGALILLELKLLNYIDVGTCLAEDVEKKLEIDDSLSSCYLKCEELHKLGNEFFVNKQTKSALFKYTSARDLIPNAKAETEDEKNKMADFYIKLSVNMIMCHNKIGTFKSSCSIAKKLFESNFEKADLNAKLHYHYAKALIALKEFDMASKYLKRAQALERNSLEITKLVTEFTRQKSECENQDKSFCKKGLELDEDSKKVDQSCEESEEVLIRTELESFKKNKQAFMILPNGLNSEELDIYRALCKSMNLEFIMEKYENTVKCSIRNCS